MVAAAGAVGLCRDGANERKVALVLAHDGDEDVGGKAQEGGVERARDGGGRLDKARDLSKQVGLMLSRHMCAQALRGSSGAQRTPTLCSWIRR